MFKARAKTLLLIALFNFIASSAVAAGLIINARPPAPQNTDLVSTASLYYAGAAGGATGFSGASIPVDLFRGFQIVNTSDFTVAGSFLTVDIQSNSTFTVPSGETLQIVFSINSGDTVIPIQGYGIVSDSDVTTIPTNCAFCSSANYVANTRTRVSLRASDICSTGGTGTLCDVMTIGSTLAKTIFVTVGPTTSGVLTPGSNDHAQITFNLTSRAPTVSGQNCTTPIATQLPEQNFYFPGDGEILIDPINFGAGVGTSGAPIGNLVLLAKVSAPGGSPDLINPSSPSAAFGSNDVYAFISNSGAQRVQGSSNTFQNDTFYNGVVYSENIAGIISTTCIGNDSATGIKPRQIYGVLQTSKCFIATAAYHDANVYPVMLLRQFRDEILLKFAPGKAFVKMYYHYSPALAEWAWDKPLIRKITLKFLTPIEVLAYLLLNPFLFFILALALLSFRIGWKKLSPFFLIFICVHSFAQGSNAPYLDKLKKQIAEEDAKKSATQSSPPSSGSYSEEQKKKLTEEDVKSKKVQSSGSYSEEIKKKLKAEENTSKDYTEKERAKLPPKEDESFIAEVKAGKDKRHPPERPNIQSAFALKLGINPGVEVAAENGVRSFSQVYGSDWKPDIFIHYERQLFHDENFGSFAPTLDVGFSYAGGYGLFAYDFAGTSRSKTSFTLLQVPLLFGANYRFNLMRIIRPYAQGSLGIIGVSEIRNDKKKDKHDFSPVYSVTGGVSFLLDFLDSKSMRDSYDSQGIQHVFFFVEYMYLRTIAGTVAFGRNGLYSGFLFEM